jgi:hypothetical protein
MKISFIQSKIPEKTEQNLLVLRKKYETDIIFHNLWYRFVKIFSWLMKLDAKFQPKSKILNIAFVFIKNGS